MREAVVHQAARATKEAVPEKAIEGKSFKITPDIFRKAQARLNEGRAAQKGFEDSKQQEMAEKMETLPADLRPFFTDLERAVNNPQTPQELCVAHLMRSYYVLFEKIFRQMSMAGTLVASEQIGNSMGSDLVMPFLRGHLVFTDQVELKKFIQGLFLKCVDIFFNSSRVQLSQSVEGIRPPLVRDFSDLLLARCEARLLVFKKPVAFGEIMKDLSNGAFADLEYKYNQRGYKTTRPDANETLFEAFQDYFPWLFFNEFPYGKVFSNIPGVNTGSPDQVRRVWNGQIAMLLPSAKGLEQSRLQELFVNGSFDEVVDLFRTLHAKAPGTEKSDELTLPDLRNLPKLHEHMVVFMRRLAIHGKVKDALEKGFFGDNGVKVNGFAEQYHKASCLSPFGLLGISRRKLMQTLDQVNHLPPKLKKAVEVLYLAFEKVTVIFGTGKILHEHGADEEQKNQGEVFMEAARMISQKLHKFAVLVECNLNFQEADIAGLGDLLGELDTIVSNLETPEDFMKKMEVELRVQGELSGRSP